jgi:hypothetical protein
MPVTRNFLLLTGAVSFAATAVMQFLGASLTHPELFVCLLLLMSGSLTAASAVRQRERELQGLEEPDTSFLRVRWWGGPPG